MINRAQMYLNSFVEVSSANPDDARRRRLLNIVLTTTGAISVLGMIVSLLAIIFSLFPNPGFILSASFAATCGSLGIYYLNRSGSGALAINLFMLLVMVVIILADDPHQLVNGRSTFLFVLPILFAGLLLGSRNTWIFYGLTSVEMVLLTIYAGSDPIETGISIISFILPTALVWMSASSIEQTLGDLRAINANLDNIVTERTHALAESLGRERAEAGRSQAILSSIADGVVVFNADNMIILVNPALIHLTGTPIQNLNEWGMNEFIQSGELDAANQTALLDMIQHPDQTESGTRIEWGKKTLSVSIARVHDTLTRENIGTVAVFRDITSEAEIEKMKNTFVAVVSHELRTPLNAIIGHTEILQGEIHGLLNTQQTSITERIMVNSRRLLAMVGDLLDEAQMKAGKLSIGKQSLAPHSLLENMHITMDKIVTDKGLSLTDECDPGMPETIINDPKRLQQIIVNLVNNAVKFTKTGGVHVHIFPSDTTHWNLAVTDTGLGMPESEIPYIFETFRQIENSTTRQHSGFGLGLSIVKQLVDLMNGTITVKSELGQGSTFTITLPFIVEKEN